MSDAIVPAIVTAVLFFVFGGRQDPLRARLQASVWAIGFFVASFYSLGLQQLRFPPQEFNEAWMWSAITLALFVWIHPRTLGVRYLLRALFVAAIGLIVLWPMLESLRGPVHLRNLLAFFFLGLGTWSILERTAQVVKPTTLMALPLISVVALYVLLLSRGGLELARMVSIFGIMLGMILAVAIVFPTRVTNTAILPFVSALVVAFMVAAHFYLHINPWTLLYLCVPFLLLWMRAWLPFVPRDPRGEALVLGLVALIPLVYLLWDLLWHAYRLFSTSAS